MSEPAPFDVDALMRRVQATAQASRTVPASASPSGALIDDHADALAAAIRRCEEAFDNLGRPESRVTQLSRIVGRRRAGPSPIDEAMRALCDVVNRLDTRHRHDIEYLLDHVAELERRALVAEDVAHRVHLLEHSPDGAVVDLAHFGNWFASFDLVLWTGDAEGPVHDAIARRPRHGLRRRTSVGGRWRGGHRRAVGHRDVAESARPSPLEACWCHARHAG